MKFTLAVLALSVTAAGAFQAGPVSPRTSSALAMGGFLDGRGAKVTIRDEEDSDMWFDDKKKGRVASEPKKPDPKKPVAAEPKKKGGFKFPWDN